MPKLIPFLSVRFKISKSKAVSPIPRILPNKDIATDSSRNVRMIVSLFAPKALRIPICGRLSSTETYIMFAIPNPPESKANRPIIHPSFTASVNRLFISSIRKDSLFKAKLSGSSGVSLLAVRIRLRIASLSAAESRILLLMTGPCCPRAGISLSASMSTGLTVVRPAFPKMPITSYRWPSSQIFSPRFASASAPTTVTAAPSASSPGVNPRPCTIVCGTSRRQSPATPTVWMAVTPKTCC